MTAADARALLAGIGLPGDPDTPAASASRFADGGHYKWEVAGALLGPSVRALSTLLEDSGIRLHQVTNTVGTMRYLDDQIVDLVAATAETGTQLRMAVGPRGQFDIGGQRLAPSPVAAASAFRLRGSDQLAYALDDVVRAIGLGVRGFLVFDEGLLVALDELRASGALPADLRLKASSNMGAGNPAHVRALARLGADSVNVQRDLDVRMVAGIRSATEVPLDLHTDNPASTGGFVRGYDVPLLVEAGAPVYLKAGNAAQDFSDREPDAATIRDIAHQIRLDAAMIARTAPHLLPSDTPEF